MNFFKKSFKTTKIQKIVGIIYFILCISVLFSSVSIMPNISTKPYDLLIFKISNIITPLLFLLLPILFFKIKGKKKIYKISSIILFIFACFFSKSFISILHTNDYELRYNEYNKTTIRYNERSPNLDLNNNKNNFEQEDLPVVDENKNNINFDNEQENFNNSDVIIPDYGNDLEIDDVENISNNLMYVHYIDVGQGDSIFIELPNKMTMLIDAGISSKGPLVASYIKKLGYNKIDYLIGTHPHVDHIGGLAYIINNFVIGKIYMPKVVATSKTYENLLNTISNKGLKVITAKSGVEILMQEKLKAYIIAPTKDYSDLNNNSAVIKVVYDNNKFLFMGDAEIKSENDITYDLSADVIKVGHHGSDTSSGQSFVNKVNPKYAIIMVGNNNQYNHPYQIIIDRWINSGAKVYRTDINGNIIVRSDGNFLDINSFR